MPLYVEATRKKFGKALLKKLRAKKEEWKSELV